jgi:inner membrane protein
MDNLTHGLLGATLSLLRRRDGGPEHDAPLSATDKAVTWGSILAAELPDIDVFFGHGPMDEYRFHRGLTHSLFFAPVIAAVATGAVKLIWREARSGTVYGWSLLAVLVGHLLNDWMTGWGTRLLLPFSEARLTVDWVPIVDLLYTIPLLVAVLLAWKRPHLRRRAAVGTLAYLLLYTAGYRGVAHALVERATKQHYAGQTVQQLRVSPDLFNPLAWRFAVDLGDRYEQGVAFPFGAVQPEVITPKAVEDEVIRAVRTAPELKPFFDQFSFPYIEYHRVDNGYRVLLSDIRYRMREARMDYTVLLEHNLKVKEIRQGGL